MVTYDKSVDNLNQYSIQPVKSLVINTLTSVKIVQITEDWEVTTLSIFHHTLTLKY